MVCGLVLAGPGSTRLDAQELTVQVGAPAPAPTTVVARGDTWRYRIGTSAPVAGWQTASEGALDGSWLTGPGGFGFSTDWAPETNLCATGVSSMFNVASSLYTRRSFEVVEPVDATRRLILTVDFDDGFVAYLDGVELARFNAPGAAGTEPAFSAVATASHESSNGNPNNTPLPAMTFDLGPVGNRLAPGAHVFSVLGLNRAANSSDFVLVAELSLVGGAQSAGGGPLFAVVQNSPVPLTGTNTHAGSSRVQVNGEEAAFTPGGVTWSHTQPLVPGLNRLHVAALAPDGAIVASLRRDVLYQTPGPSVGGVLTENTVWDGANGTILVTNNLVIPDGVTLTLTNGAVVLVSPGVSIRATTNGVVRSVGAPGRPILFAPLNGATAWGDIGAFGAGAVLDLRWTEVVAGQIRPVNGGRTLIQDSVLRDYNVAGAEFISADNGGELTLRRVYAARFGEMDASETPVLIEDSLLEEFAVDGLDIKGTNVPLVVRATTVRRADPSNSNADGLDFGPGPGTVEDCLIYGFPDKGISIGGGSGTTVRHSLIFDCGSGIAVNASTNCWFDQTTISGCSTGLFFRAAGTSVSRLAGTNNILWANANPVAFTGNSTLELEYTDIEGGYPGTGNLNANPLFVDPPNGNYRLAAGSPARGAGLGGVDLGPDFTTRRVGGLPPAPFRLAALTAGTGPITVQWQEDSDNEDGFELERSVNGSVWEVIAAPAGGLGANVRSHVDATAPLGQRVYYRVRAVNGAGGSDYSNLAGAIREESIVKVGGVLQASTTWSPALGTIHVVSPVIVPTNVTLTIAPGTVVKMTNTAALRAVAGGTIHVAGTAASKVTLMPLVAGSQWLEVSGQFEGAHLTIQHADISGGQITVYSNAVGLVEDSFIHDYRLLSGGSLFTSPIILTHFAAPTVVRRCHIREYHETLWRNGILTIEDCLFENVHGDAVDFDSAQPGTVIRRCTFRHGTNGNVDAVDVGPGDIPGSFDVRIEDCMMFNFPFDKGVSVGDRNSSRGTIVSNCFIYACLSGVMAKDGCDVSVRQSTIVNNNWGLTNYNKVNPSSPTGAGITTNTYNNIIWNNGITISMVNGGQLYADHNILSATNWPGEANIDVDPLFVNPAANDFRLQAGSPARGAGRDGADLGARFPVGAPMVSSHPVIRSIAAGSPGQPAVIEFWADNEKSYSLLASDQVSGGTWSPLVSIPAGGIQPRYISVTNTVAPGHRFYQLVTPQLP